MSLALDSGVSLIQAVLEDIRREGEETVDDIEDVYKDIETQKVG